MKIKPLLRGGASLFIGVALGASAHAAPSAQSWRNAAQPVDARVASLLAAMTFEQKVALVNSVDPADYSVLAPLGIPALTRVDASAGLRGDSGVTAFPVPLQLGASFDTALARDYGSAIAAEARAKGWNLILGPTVDVARDGLSGRLTESFGEDPLVNGAMGAAVAQAMQSQHVIAMAKHYTAYHTERDRLKMNVVVSPRALNEIYNLPFNYLIEQARIGALMGSYPKINGTFMLENAKLIKLIKQQGFKGYMATDFLGGSDAVAQFNAGIDSWALQPFLRKPAAFSNGAIAASRLDDAVKRTLWALFSTGTFDHPVTTTPAAIATTAAHQALAVRVAEAGTVLLKNDNGLLPLQRTGQIAVIGAAGKDVITGVQWSSFVDPGQFTTPVEAIAALAGSGAKVVQAQGSLGDVVLPLLALPEGPFGAPLGLTAPGGKPGWQVHYFGNASFSGPALREDVVKDVDVSNKPWTTMPDQWSARWSADYTPDASGLVRLSASLSGHAKVTVDGRTVIDGTRSTASGFPGSGFHTYPLQGTVNLTAGRTVRIEVEYSTAGAWSAPRIALGWQARSLIPAAVELARQSSVAVVFVNQVSGEEMDRDNYQLPADQNALIEAVSAVNPNTVVVLNTGGAVKMPWLAKVKAVLQMWYPGAASGSGIANVLFGQADPGGRLPVSFPADESQGPRPYQGGGEVNYSEGALIGYNYLQQHRQKPLFAFGHGLSYTSSSVDQLVLAPLGADDDSAAASVRVKNTGARAGATVVQLYAGPLPGPVATGPAKLVGFAKVWLQPGAEQTVQIALPRRLLSYWDEAASRWVTPPGKVRISAGLASDNIAVSGELTLAAKR